MASTPDPHPQPQTLINNLQTLLTSLQTAHYPDLASPPDCKKRASVAFILRVKPSYSPWPSSSTTTTSSSQDPHTLASFFSQEWVQYGTPELLFIKRASRKGDRWTSHIALPGGKRDPGDADDKAAAIRESIEEVGLDVSTHGIPCGNLPQRIVTTHWGKKPLLVLCPYIFLLTTHEIPPLRLQPSEVASTHWVPLSSLQAPGSRTVVFEDVSSRLANQETGLKRWMYSALLGKMMFAAIDLQPTESVYSAESPAPQNPQQQVVELQDNRHALPTTSTRLRALLIRAYHADIFSQLRPPQPPAPLHLWGLTLGVISDFLDLLPPHDALELWTYPTFTPLDVRFIVWLATYNFKARKRAELQAGTQFLGESKGRGVGVGGPAFGFATESVAPSISASSEPVTKDETLPSESTVLVEKEDREGDGVAEAADETGLHGLGTGTTTPSTTPPRRDKKAAVQTMLSGFVESLAQACLPRIGLADRARYYEILRKAVAVALVGRLGMLGVLVWWIVRRRRSLAR